MTTGAVYDTIGRAYARQRRADPRIGAHLTAALGGARSVLNVGAGAGSYEPSDRRVVGTEAGLERLRADLESGAWHARHGQSLAADTLDAGYRLVVADLPDQAA